MFRKYIPIMMAIILLCLSIGGCGVYTSQSASVDESLEMVAVEYLENNTPQPNLGVDLSEDIISELRDMGILKVTDMQNADTIISGTVVRYSVREVAARSDMTVNEYRVQISIKLSFFVRATGEYIFKNKTFSGTGIYNLDDPDTGDGSSATTEEGARLEATKEIVQDVKSEIVTDW